MVIAFFTCLTFLHLGRLKNLYQQSSAWECRYAAQKVSAIGYERSTEVSTETLNSTTK